MNTLADIRFVSHVYDRRSGMLKLNCLTSDGAPFTLLCSKSSDGLVTRLHENSLTKVQPKGRDYIHIESGLVFNWVTHIVNNVSKSLSKTSAQYDFKNRSIIIDFSQQPPRFDEVQTASQHTSLFSN